MSAAERLKGNAASVQTEDVLQHIKPAVRAARSYTLTPRTLPIKIDQNENPFELPESLKRKVVAQALERPWGRYPEFDPRELLEALARHADWRADGILAGNGSNEMIEALLMVAVGPGTKVIIPEPTFTLYALMTTILGGQAVRVGLDANLEYDATALREARRRAQAPLAIVCTPNNPTGGVLASDDISALCSDADGLVVIDEAYHEFAGSSAVPLLARHPNLVVLRTFSKALGMAGLRLGYLLASPEIVREVNKARLPYNINFFTQLAALTVLSEYDEVRTRVRRIIELRQTLLTELARLPGVRVYPTAANFILVEFLQAEPQTVFEKLMARGVLVRNVTSYPRLARCLRISVGTAEENAVLLAALTECLAAPQSKEVA
ncbi:MAG: histidinol-phosphate transaminase [Vicinamibacteria bacterium]|jgi:histidinol-phosphate aminotransferase|nr:histidinol-phosphate transaminase [Vicinamibacteria bacterium]